MIAEFVATIQFQTINQQVDTQSETDIFAHVQFETEMPTSPRGTSSLLGTVAFVSPPGGRVHQVYEIGGFPIHKAYVDMPFDGLYAKELELHRSTNHLFDPNLGDPTAVFDATYEDYNITGDLKFGPTLWPFDGYEDFWGSSNWAIRIPEQTDYRHYIIELTYSGTDDTTDMSRFKWSNDGGQTWVTDVEIHNSSMYLEDNLYILFHNVADLSHHGGNVGDRMSFQTNLRDLRAVTDDDIATADRYYYKALLQPGAYFDTLMADVGEANRRSRFDVVPGLVLPDGDVPADEAVPIECEPATDPEGNNVEYHWWYLIDYDTPTSGWQSLYTFSKQPSDEYIRVPPGWRIINVRVDSVLWTNGVEYEYLEAWDTIRVIESPDMGAVMEVEYAQWIPMDVTGSPDSTTQTWNTPSGQHSNVLARVAAWDGDQVAFMDPNTLYNLYSPYEFFGPFAITAPPDPPVLLRPARNATTEDGTPIIKVVSEQVSAPVTSLFYHVEIATDAGFTNIIRSYNQRVAPGYWDGGVGGYANLQVATLTVPAIGELPQQLLYIRARCWDSTPGRDMYSMWVESYFTPWGGENGNVATEVSLRDPVFGRDMGSFTAMETRLTLCRSLVEGAGCRYIPLIQIYDLGVDGDTPVEVGPIAVVYPHKNTSPSVLDRAEMYIDIGVPGSSGFVPSSLGNDVWLMYYTGTPEHNHRYKVVVIGMPSATFVAAMDAGTYLMHYNDIIAAGGNVENDELTFVFYDRELFQMGVSV